VFIGFQGEIPCPRDMAAMVDGGVLPPHLKDDEPVTRIGCRRLAAYQLVYPGWRHEFFIVSEMRHG
jgi:hypothetical protein